MGNEFAFAAVAAAASAEGGGELSGFVGADIRLFADSPALTEQTPDAASPSGLFQPEFRYEWNNGEDRLTVVPFARLEFDDEERRHFDLRELDWLHSDLCEEMFHAQAARPD